MRTVINGAFLVDKISLLTIPHVNGNAREKSTFNTLGEYVDDTFKFDQIQVLADSDIHITYPKDALI
ncbi:MAG: hypothetical protein LIR10_08715 [Bacillota bacterium]|nr:hypothetical protein [Bacillota bacterium]